MSPEYRPLVGLTGDVRKDHEPHWEFILTVAVFKPLRIVEREWEEFRNHAEIVWEKLVQKVVTKDEVDAHVADGWHTDASAAMVAADTEQVKQDNEQLQSQIDEANDRITANTAKVDGRSKEGRALKKLSGVPLYFNPETKVIFGSDQEQSEAMQKITADDVPDLIANGATVDSSAESK